MARFPTSAAGRGRQPGGRPARLAGPRLRPPGAGASPGRHRDRDATTGDAFPTRSPRSRRCRASGPTRRGRWRPWPTERPSARSTSTSGGCSAGSWPATTHSHRGPSRRSPTRSSRRIDRGSGPTRSWTSGRWSAGRGSPTAANVRRARGAGTRRGCRAAAGPPPGSRVPGPRGPPPRNRALRVDDSLASRAHPRSPSSGPRWGVGHPRRGHRRARPRARSGDGCPDGGRRVARGPRPGRRRDPRPPPAGLSRRPDRPVRLAGHDPHLHPGRSRRSPPLPRRRALTAARRQRRCRPTTRRCSTRTCAACAADGRIARPCPPSAPRR